VKYPTRQAVSDRKYLDWLRTQRCILTGQYGNDYDAVDPCHVGTRGRGLKTDDEVLPILHSLHSAAHASGEISLLREKAPDSLLREAFRALARENYKEWKDGER